MTAPIATADRSDIDVKLLEYDARNLADTIKQELPEGVGFALFLFDYGGKGRLTYLSTATRETMLETIGRWLVLELEKAGHGSTKAKTKTKKGRKR